MFRLVSLLVLLFLTLTPVQAANKLALIIGNADYKDAPLRNPVNDATDMATALRGLGFEVIERNNLSSKSMLDELRQFEERLKNNNSVGLFYYSGHGMQIDGSNYLIPVNSNIQHENEVKFNALNADMVLSKMQQARNGLNIVILDACRNNPFYRRFKSKSKGLARADVPLGSVLVYATSPGGVASDGDANSQGLFTRHLLRHIKTPGIDINDVLLRTRRDVVQDSNEKQIPWDSSSLTSNFCFAGCSAPETEIKTRVVEKKVYVQVPKIVYKDRSTGEVIEEGAASGYTENSSDNCHSHTPPNNSNSVRHCHANPTGKHW